MSELQKGARLARDLNALLSLRMAVPEALAHVRRSSPQDWGANLQKAEEAARSGATLGQSLKMAGGFPALLVDGLSGNADEPESLARLAGLLEQAEGRQRQIRLALSYPVLLLIAGMSLVGLIYGLLGSTFRALFESMNVRLSLPAALNLALVKLVCNPLFITLEVLVVVALYCVLAGVGGLGRLRLRLPLVGSWLRRNEAVTWLGWLDYFLAAGQALPGAIREAGAACSDAAFRSGVAAVAALVEKGDRFDQAVAKQRLLPPLAQWMVARGEFQEFPPDYLAGVAVTLERELQAESARGFAWVEIFGMLFVMFIVPPAILGFFLPLYQLIGNLG